MVEINNAKKVLTLALLGMGSYCEYADLWNQVNDQDCLFTFY